MKQLREEIKNPRADPSTHPCPQASTSKGQDLTGNRSWSISSPAICSPWQQQAGSLLPPMMSSCCWGTAVLLSPLPLSLGVLLLLVGQKDGRMFINTFVSITLWISVRKDPQASSKSSLQIVFLPRGPHSGAG